MKPLIYFDEFETHGDNVEIKKEALSKFLMKCIRQDMKMEREIVI